MLALPRSNERLTAGKNIAKAPVGIYRQFIACPRCYVAHAGRGVVWWWKGRPVSGTFERIAGSKESIDVMTMFPKSAHRQSAIRDGISPSASTMPAAHAAPETTSPMRRTWPAAPEHTVQFYADDDFLVEQISHFVYDGLTAGETCVVIATKDHRERLEQHLAREGNHRRRRTGRYAQA